jgi:hypothetical protein
LASYGKVVRWVKVKEGGDVIRDALSGRKVAKSDGAKVVERLEEIEPNDLDLEAYINDANKILKIMGCDSSESWF